MQKNFLWWRDGAIYQIYPRSYKDSKGDGIGDLAGITDKLDYLVDLGVDAIWLSPFYPSPDVDFGYDISKYCDVDLEFGSLADFDKLVKNAEKRGIRIVLDLVLNHTSNQHNWFIQSSASRDNPWSNWYLWRDADVNGNPPNNWHSITGGRGWEWNQSRGQYYFHMFYKEQPDLNWHHPQVRQNLMNVFKFWLERGVKGFRLDVFNLYFKDAHFRNNPKKIIGLRPFDRQEHIYDCDLPELMDALSEIRSILDGYDDPYMIGETFLSTPQKAAGYCGCDLLHQAFNFDFLECPWQAGRFSRAVAEWESALGDTKWPNYVLNNHDAVRSASRYGTGEDDERLKVAATMLLTLRGTPFIYYGEEIGMRNIKMKRSEILDPVGRYYWPFFKGRDGCRAPMQWDAGINGGFSNADPWLPLHPNWRRRHVAGQILQTGSLLDCYKKLLSLRKVIPALSQGSMRILSDMPAGVFGYERKTDYERALVLLNFFKVPRRVTLPETAVGWKSIFSTRRSSGTFESGSVTLDPDEGLVLLNPAPAFAE